MRLSKVDLNLFVVFEAVYRTRNLTRAAEMLFITHPAVSNALARMRKAFDDQLFVSTSAGMMPTPVSENIIGQVREGVQLLDSSTHVGERFDPASPVRTSRTATPTARRPSFCPHWRSCCSDWRPASASKATSRRVERFRKR